MSAAFPPAEPLAIKRLLPPAPPATAQEIVESFGLLTAEPPPVRPRVLLNMVSTLDGRATIGGRSGRIGAGADRELFHALRTVVDAVMVGAGTARAERYRRLVREEEARALRRARGLREEPLACIVSGRLALNPEEIPLLTDPAACAVILTPSQASIETSGAGIEYIRAAREGRLDLAGAMAHLRERFAIRTVLCEGGPHLNTQLLAAGLVDEIFLSLAPKLAGGDASGEALRILAGMDLDPPIALELLGVCEHESHLFLRYGVPRAAGPAL
ncbi:MAG TPA: dihydrofolate reductase family protein [Solirubrobacteraceae bacterium]|jgi:riboflavin-specific deaminase-like protein|nr:dihydrofolate reductase family protein [Solirubrobacteraceae bacterium]